MRTFFIYALAFSFLFVFGCAGIEMESDSSKSTTSKSKKALELVSPLSGEKVVAKKVSASSDTAYFTAMGRFSGLDASEIYVFLKYANQNVFYRASEPVTVVREGEWQAYVYFGDKNRPARMGDVVTIIAVGKVKEDMKTFNIMTAKDVVTSDWQKDIQIATLQ